jgi:hypothetical protein
MQLNKSDKKRFFFGFLIISFIYSGNFFLFVESKFTIQPLAQHLIRFLTTIAVYFIGTFYLGKLKDTWMSSLWHMVHISGLCIITLLGLTDWFFTDISISLKQFAHSIQEALISPVLYVAMGFLNSSLNKTTS